MALFGKKNKKEEEASCCCGCNAESVEKAEDEKTGGASVKVLGSGCAKCNQLEAATKEALEKARNGYNDRSCHGLFTDCRLRRYDDTCARCGWKSSIAGQSFKA